ncbi:PREDICTED: fibroblast growth factor receptor 2-like isoform X2 [Acropora digitifera]|uniref:fibroblast growth factor receptor 2-like isoform X2 n=1 Tax=Acropora digitifera TaxID=70779 RepID=UPI00077AC5E2|nr:PREDICTED: fibroblast growth factor receptor 2-like isoform X2 [Acropora digitifera]
MKLFTFWAALLCIVKVLATGSPQFICNSHGIKRYTNHTSSVPEVHMKCPSVVKRDATAEISCKVMSKTFAVISWFYNGQPIKQLGKSHLKIDSLSCQQRLKIKFAMSSDSGNYTCTVTNTNSTITKTCHLVVKASKPDPVHIGELKISGGCKKACLGGSVNLICNMLDIEAFSWKKDDQEIRSERHVWKRNNTYGARGVKLYLEIINVTKSDEGVYECVGHKSGVQSTKALFLETEPCPHELDPVSSATEEHKPETFRFKSRGHGAGASNNILISSVLVVIKTQIWN